MSRTFGTVSIGLRAPIIREGDDMVKIVTLAQSEADIDKILALYQWCREEKISGNERIGALSDGGLIAFCMGEAGRESRLECLRRGAPFTYVALDGDEAVAKATSSGYQSVAVGLALDGAKKYIVAMAN